MFVDGGPSEVSAARKGDCEAFREGARRHDSALQNGTIKCDPDENSESSRVQICLFPALVTKLPLVALGIPRLFPFLAS